MLVTNNLTHLIIELHAEMESSTQGCDPRKITMHLSEEVMTGDRKTLKKHMDTKGQATKCDNAQSKQPSDEYQDYNLARMVKKLAAAVPSTTQHQSKGGSDERDMTLGCKHFGDLKTETVKPPSQHADVGSGQC